MADFRGYRTNSHGLASKRLLRLSGILVTLDRSKDLTNEQTNAFKGPNVCAQKFSRASPLSPLRLSASPPLRLSASPPLRLSVSASSPLRLFVSLSLRLSASPPLRLFASFVSPPLRLSASPPLRLFVSLSLRLSASFIYLLFISNFEFCFQNAKLKDRVSQLDNDLSVSRQQHRDAAQEVRSYRTSDHGRENCPGSEYRSFGAAL